MNAPIRSIVVDLEKARAELKRQAVVMEIGGFRSSNEIDESWFGRVKLALPDEAWPETEGEPMHAPCQINLTKLPFKPKRLEDIELLTLFIGPTDLPVDENNGSNWCLRAYPCISDLIELEQVDSSSWIKPFPMRPTLVDEDFPCHEDINIELPEELRESYYSHFNNISGFKLGGWPTLIQSEIYWAPNNEHPAVPEYVFQIDTTEKGNWMWGDGGVGYFGRGTKAGHDNEWTIEWQCY